MESPSSPSNLSRHIGSRSVACRECRRSKIRCSRSFPCDACVRRGCTDICPDGIKQTKRSKSDETLLQENARLVRRIRHLEGILLSMKHPAALSDDLYNDPSSPSQESQSSEMQPLSDSPDPKVNDTLLSTHDRDTSNSVPALTRSDNYSYPSQGEPDFLHDAIRALKFQLTRNRASLGPGFQFALRALLELHRTCGIIDTHDSSESRLLDVTSSEVHSNTSIPSPSSTSPSSSSGPLSDTPALASEIDANPRPPTLTDGVEQLDWNLSNMTMPTFPPSTDGDRTQFTTLHVPDQVGESLFQSGQESPGQGNEPMSSELCQRLLLDLAIMQEKEGWRP